MTGRLLKTSMAAVLMVMLFCAAALAASAPPVLLGEKPLQFDVQPFIEKGTTYVPLRAIFEALGASVSWDQATKTVTATRQGNKVTLTIGDPVAHVNLYTVYLDAPAKVVNGRTMVPLRFVTQSLGAEIQRDEKSRIIILPNKTGPQPAPGEAASPGGLTGDKLTAYKMLTACKYSGKSSSSWSIDIYEVPFEGTVHIDMTTETSGNRTAVTTKGVPPMYGQDLVKEYINQVPYKELVDSENSVIQKVLESAQKVRVEENTIILEKANPPDSILEIANRINQNLKWYSNKLDLSCKINIQNNRVISLSDLVTTGKVMGKSGAWLPVNLKATVYY